MLCMPRISADALCALLVQDRPSNEERAGKTLNRVGQELGLCVRERSIILAPTCNPPGWRPSLAIRKEFLWDLLWLDPVHADLIAEQDSETNERAALWDFEKLLYGKARLKVFVWWPQTDCLQARLSEQRSVPSILTSRLHRRRTIWNPRCDGNPRGVRGVPLFMACEKLARPRLCAESRVPLGRVVERAISVRLAPISRRDCNRIGIWSSQYLPPLGSVAALA
jgi:hypothetical protein